MSFLSGLTDKLRNGADDIGSFITGEPAHSPALPQMAAPIPSGATATPLVGQAQQAAPAVVHPIIAPQNPMNPMNPAINFGINNATQIYHDVNGNPTGYEDALGSHQFGATPQIAKNPTPSILDNIKNNANNVLTGTAHSLQHGVNNVANFVASTPDKNVVAPFIMNNVVKPVTNTLAAPVEAGRSLAAEATFNPQAQTAADKREISDIQNSLPRQIASGAIQFGNAARYAPGAISNEVRGDQKNISAQQGLNALNKSYQGLGLTGAESAITHNIPTASKEAQSAGFDPNQSIKSVIAKTVAGAASDLAPLAGAEYGDPLGLYHGTQKVVDAATAGRNAVSDWLKNINVKPVYADNSTHVPNQKFDMGTPASPTVQAAQQLFGQDVSGYHQTMDNYAITHAMKDPSITQADIQKVPEIISNPDHIYNGGKTDQGLETLVYHKELDRHNYYVEEIRNGKYELAMKTLNKFRNPDPERSNAVYTAPNLTSERSPLGGSSSTVPHDTANVNPSKGFIIKESKPLPDGSKLVVRATRNPETGKMVQFQERVDKNTDLPMEETRGTQPSGNPESLLRNTPDLPSTERSLQAPQPQDRLDRQPLPTDKPDTHTTSLVDNTPKDEVQIYANIFGVTRLQAKEDLMEMQKQEMQRNTLDIPEGASGPPNSPTIEQRREIIRDNPNQQTNTKLSLDVEKGNTKGAIAKALAISEERDRKLALATRNLDKLSSEDKHLFLQWEDGANPSELVTHAQNPKAFTEAIKTNIEANDYHLAADRAAGGSTLRQNNYGLPKIFRLPEEEMDARGIPTNQRFKNGNYTGYHDTSSKYRSYLDANRQSGLEPLYDNPAQAVHEYNVNGSKTLREQLLKTALAKAAPEHIGALDDVRTGEGKRLTQAAGHLPFSATDELQKNLKNFRDPWKSGNRAVDTGINFLEKAGSKSKALLFFGAPFHYANGYSRFLGLTGTSGHGLIAGRGTGEALGSSLVPHVYKAIYNKAEKDGVVQYIKENGGELRSADKKTILGDGIIPSIKRAGNTVNPVRLSNANMSQFFNSMMISLGRAAKAHGIESGSTEAQQLFAEYNKVLGHFNAAVEGGDVNLQRLLSGEALAPRWIQTQLGLVKDAAVKSTFKADGKHVLGMYNAGDVARTTVLGTRLVEGAAATIVTALALGQMPTLHDAIRRFGLTAANPVPNIDLGEKDQKGRHQLIDLPTDPLGLGTGLITDPQHFTQSRLSPGLSTIDRLVTNKDWNGNPLSDPNDPNALQKRIMGSFKGDLPIGLQNFTNPNITPQQGLMQEVGGRVKTDPEDPQQQASTGYFNTQGQFAKDIKGGNFSAIDPSLSDISPSDAAYWTAQLQKYGLSAGKDSNGVSNDKEWNALSADQKASFLLRNNQQTGSQELSPIFFINKQLAALDPSRPHDPLYDLTGNGVNQDGSGSPKAQIALNYAKDEDPSVKQIMLQNNPWLKEYEGQVGSDAQNYKQNMTSYLQGQGWQQSAIDKYWQQHPQSPQVIPQAPVDAPTQAKIDQLGMMTDAAQRTAFIKANPDIGVAFNDIANQANQLRAAKGEYQLKGYPTASQHVQQILNSMLPSGPKGNGAANAKLINANPDVQNFLADVASYGLNQAAARDRYQGQDYTQAGLKDINEFGKYDTTKLTNGLYAQIAGTLSNGQGLAGNGYYTGMPTTPGATTGYVAGAAPAAPGYAGYKKGGSSFARRQARHVRRVRTPRTHAKFISKHKPAPIHFFSEQGKTKTPVFQVAKAKPKTVKLSS